jgi:hypothetical protein
MKREIERYTQTCEECQKNKTLKKRKAELLQPLAVPNRVWEFIAMDFVMQLLKTARGKTAIMVVVDKLSKQYHLVATRDEATSIDTAKLFVERIYSQHGMPRSIVSDRDLKFTAQFW